jgi:hypothetical protein
LKQVVVSGLAPAFNESHSYADDNVAPRVVRERAPEPFRDVIDVAVLRSAEDAEVPAARVEIEILILKSI